MEKVTINATKICEFADFNSWVNYATIALGGYQKNHEPIICLDVDGNTCHTGEDFNLAFRCCRFPVTAYLLLRSKDVADVIVTETIGEKLKRIRKEKGYSQVNVAIWCGISQAAYAKIENGTTQNITIPIGKGISKALMIPFNELFEI